MGIKSGFFNAINHDRQYDAKDICEIFDGLFTDGVFQNVSINGSASINKCFQVRSGTGMSVIVGPGKAWFNHTYTINDEDLTLELQPAHGTLYRRDIVVIEVNNSLDVRRNTIKVVTGAPSSSVDPPTPGVIRNNYINQYVIAQVYIKPGVTSPSGISNTVGASHVSGYAPYAQGLVPKDYNVPFSFGKVSGSGRYGYIKNGETVVTPFTPFDFGIDSDGNYGYIKRGADTVTPFKTGDSGGGSVSGATIKKVATITQDSTINLINKSGFENVWESLTTSNFYFRINSVNINKSRTSLNNNDTQTWYKTTYNGYPQTDGRVAFNSSTGTSIFSITPSLSYNANTGNLTVSGLQRTEQCYHRLDLDIMSAVNTNKVYSYDQTVYDTNTLSVSVDVYAAY